MRIRYITCSDPRNHNTISEMFDLWNIDPRVEIAVQMHPGKVSFGTARYNWIMQLLGRLRDEKVQHNLAVHVNMDWCDDLCNNDIPNDLMPVLFAKSEVTKNPLVGRIQLNMPAKTATNIQPYKLASLVNLFARQHQKIIIQYNQTTKNAVEQLYKIGTRVDLLFDSSGGRGISPKSWGAPVAMARMMGYAGGLSPENVRYNLDKIKSVAGDSIWLDAEGGLKSDDKFDSTRAAQYIKNIISWENSR